MANTGFTIAGTGANNADAGNAAWSNPTRVTASDNSRARAVTSGAGSTSQYLHATNFGFAIPAGATINGVVARIARLDIAPSSGIVDHTVQLIKGGSRQGDNKAAAGNWPGTETDKDYGSSTDLWGLTLTTSDVNASNFGFALRFTGNSLAGDGGDVDAMWLDVYYTVASGQPAVKRMGGVPFAKHSRGVW